MEKEVLTKVSRYITLSKKFQKSADEIFDTKKENSLTFNTNGGSLSIASIGYYSSGHQSFIIDNRELYIGEDGVVKAKDKQPITRAEKILAQAKLDAIIADEYDEYIKLQNDLTKYFESLENLIK